MPRGNKPKDPLTNSSKNYSANEPKGVPRKVREQLAVDIKEAGGIQDFDKEEKFALDQLLNKRKDVYLERGNPLRHKMRNLVADWKSHSKEKHLSKVVVPYMIQRVEDSSNEADDESTNTATFSQHSCQPVKSKDCNNSTKKSSNCADEDEGLCSNLKETTSPLPKKTKPKPHIPIASKKTQLSAHKRVWNRNMANELGKTLVVKMPDNGLHFAIVWVDSKLSNLEFVVSEDGFSVLQRSKTPQPDSASDLLSHCTWASDPFHVVINSVNAELKMLKEKAQAKQKDQWTNSEVITLDEEVVRAFVDIHGNPTNSVGYNGNSDGRQIITFFLKTMEAHRTIPSKGNFTNSDSTKQGPTGMEVGDEDGSFCDESVQDVRSEMDEKFNLFADQMKSMMGAFQQMQQQQQHFQQQMTHHVQTQQANQQAAQGTTILCRLTNKLHKATCTTILCLTMLLQMVGSRCPKNVDLSQMCPS